ncbi:hypothetical protein K435DRAFT_964514 [Dendrothele bispora CBS 962.96]|uniref:ABM domain-containing protein n=1 Tax=Dendrothele bispora (strain CBS 962.96) TaxID=1314807 RepID=A0A4S8MA05_DENBC|nr:hypothetical protein K435DRAFT_964514 [Dendrothele bispora CBS 962.96]
MITEYLRFRTTPSFSSDPSLFAKLREGARAAGIVNQSYGIGVEDKEVLHWIIQFDQGFGPKDFVWDEAKYGDFTKEVMKIAQEPPQSAFMHFDDDKEPFAKEVTDAPVTELAAIELKEDLSEEEASKTLNDIRSIVRKAKNGKGACWGADNDKPKNVYLFVGWESVEDHVAFTKTDSFKEVQGMMKNIISGVKMGHVAFSDHVQQ